VQIGRLVKNEPDIEKCRLHASDAHDDKHWPYGVPRP
jgi:hypothetical protein